MGPLPWGKSSGFQARSAFPTEDEKSQEGSHGGTREFASTPVFVGSFVLHKICDLVGLQGGPIEVPCTKTGGQEAPRHQEIVTTGAGSGPTDLVQILLISPEPL